MLGQVFGWLSKREDAKVETTRINRTAERDVDVAIIRNDTAGKEAQKELNLVGMDHPIWWVAWGLFVLPVGVYHAMIHWVSVFPSLGWTIQRVPPMQEQWDMYIVLSLFGAQVTSGIVKTIATSWMRR
jgi:hypothetical protein